MYALIQNNKVIQLAEETFPVHPSLKWIELDTCEVGDEYIIDEEEEEEAETETTTILRKTLLPDEVLYLDVDGKTGIGIAKHGGNRVDFDYNSDGTFRIRTNTGFGKLKDIADKINIYQSGTDTALQNKTSSPVSIYCSLT